MSAANGWGWHEKARGRNSILVREGKNFARRGSSSSSLGPRTGPAKLRHRRPRSVGAPTPSLSARSPAQHSTLQTVPEVQLPVHSLSPPRPSQLSSKKSFRPERGLFRTTGGQWSRQGWAFPSQAHSTPPRPGPRGARLRDREGELTPLPPPYLPYWRVTSPRRRQMGHGQNPDVRLGNGTPVAAAAASRIPPSLPRRERAGATRTRPPRPTPPPRGDAAAATGWAGLEGKGPRARQSRTGAGRSSPPGCCAKGAESRWVWREVGISVRGGSPTLADPGAGVQPQRGP